MKNNLRQHSILRALFIPFTVLFVVAFAAFISYFTATELEKARNEAVVTMRNNAVMISNHLDTEVTKLDTVSQNIIYSSVLKDEFSAYAAYLSGAQGTEAEKLRNKDTLSDLLIAMIGPSTPVSQIYLYTLETGGLGVGLNNTELKSVREKDWYQTVVAEAGSKVIFCEQDPQLSKYSSFGDEQKYLSLCRTFYNVTNIPQGIIEVKKPFREVSKRIEEYQSSFSEKIFIFDSKGSQVYPMDALEEGGEYYKTILSRSPKEVHSKETILCGDMYLVSQESKYTGFSTVVAVNKNELFRPVSNYLMTNLALLLFIMFSIVILSFFLARFISKPINRVYVNLKNFDLMDESSTELLEEDTHITELNALYQAFLKMQETARSSLVRELTLQQREMQARMLALQAQMNPHFLYNSLSTIQAMADEGMDSQIKDMCQSMSRILRYISSDKEQLVTVAQELKHTLDFLDCMKARFEDDLTYHIELQKEMESIKLPKLCLQLIVENSIKFMTRGKVPPWKIEITGKWDSRYWEIQVRDNGPGFAEDELKTLQGKIDQIHETGVFPALELNGMGLMNICIRLKLLYQGEHIFKLGNSGENGGAIVTIGGWVHYEQS